MDMIFIILMVTDSLQAKMDITKDKVYSIKGSIHSNWDSIFSNRDNIHSNWDSIFSNRDNIHSNWDSTFRNRDSLHSIRHSIISNRTGKTVTTTNSQIHCRRAGLSQARVLRARVVTRERQDIQCQEHFRPTNQEWERALELICPLITITLVTWDMGWAWE